MHATSQTFSCTSVYKVVERSAYRAMFFEGNEDYGVATGGTSNTLTDSTKNWGTNQWQNGCVIIVDGSGWGQCKYISSNSTAIVTISGNWVTNPNETSRYVLVQYPKKWQNGSPACYAVRELCTQAWRDYQDGMQSNIDGVRNILNSELGLSSADYIKIPTLFDKTFSFYPTKALMPNMVNSLIAGGKIIIAKPFGSKNSSGQDIFEEEAKARITSLPEVFIDDWDTYHAQDGEIHCGTNVKRTPPATNWWE